MKSRDSLIRLKRFHADEKRRQVAQMEAMIAEFERMAKELDDQILAEQERSGIHDAAAAQRGCANCADWEGLGAVLQNGKYLCGRKRRVERKQHRIVHIRSHHHAIEQDALVLGACFLCSTLAGNIFHCDDDFDAR